MSLAGNPLFVSFSAKSLHRIDSGGTARRKCSCKEGNCRYDRDADPIREHRHVAGDVEDLHPFTMPNAYVKLPQPTLRRDGRGSARRSTQNCSAKMWRTPVSIGLRLCKSAAIRPSRFTSVVASPADVLLLSRRHNECLHRRLVARLKGPKVKAQIRHKALLPRLW